MDKVMQFLFEEPGERRNEETRMKRVYTQSRTTRGVAD